MISSQSRSCDLTEPDAWKPSSQAYSIEISSSCRQQSHALDQLTNPCLALAGWHASSVQEGSAYRRNREVKDRGVFADAVGVGGLWDGDAALLERPSDGDLRLGLAQLVGDGEERRVLEALRAGDGAVALRTTDLPLSPAEKSPRRRPSNQQGLTMTTIPSLSQYSRSSFCCSHGWSSI